MKPWNALNEIFPAVLPKGRTHVLIQLPTPVAHIGKFPLYGLFSVATNTIAIPSTSTNLPFDFLRFTEIPFKADNKSLQFYNSLNNKTICNGEWMQLPDGIYLGGARMNGSRLFIRDAYKKLAGIILDNDSEMKWIISGTPGKLDYHSSVFM